MFTLVILSLVVLIVVGVRKGSLAAADSKHHDIRSFVLSFSTLWALASTVTCLLAVRLEGNDLTLSVVAKVVGACLLLYIGWMVVGWRRCIIDEEEGLAALLPLVTVLVGVGTLVWQRIALIEYPMLQDGLSLPIVYAIVGLLLWRFVRLKLVRW